jgi:methyl-accepting chemotaxis protein
MPARRALLPGDRPRRRRSQPLFGAIANADPVPPAIDRTRDAVYEQTVLLGLGDIFGDITGWGSRIADEVTRLPDVLYGVRAALARLPEQIESLVGALEQTTAALERALPELTRAIAAMEERVEHVDQLASDLAVDLARTVANLERVLPEVTNAIGGMDNRVKNLDTTISSLGSIVFGLIDAIPGARRVLRRTDPPSE